MAEILHRFIGTVVYPIIYRVSYISGGARFQPSTVWLRLIQINNTFTMKIPRKKKNDNQQGTLVYKAMVSKFMAIS